eukprot:700327_1
MIVSALRSINRGQHCQMITHCHPRSSNGNRIREVFCAFGCAEKKYKIVDILHGKRCGKDNTEEVPLAIETIDTDLQIKRIFRMNWDEGKWKIVKLKLRIKSIIKRCQENKISIT